LIFLSATICLASLTQGARSFLDLFIQTNRELTVLVSPVNCVEDMKPQRINLEASSLETAPLNYAGFWIRAFAGLIDFIILLIPFSVVVSVTAVATNIWYSFFLLLVRANRYRKTSPERARCSCR